MGLGRDRRRASPPTLPEPAVPVPWEPTGGMPALRITDVKAICTAPEGVRLIAVKVETSEPGLYGLGCATFAQRPLAVVVAIERYLKPFLLGRDPHDIEDIWQSAFVSSYWRGGPVLNNALSGVDMALWDIKGKRAGMPVYELLGGRCRKAAPLYVHAAAGDIDTLEERIRAHLDRGFRCFRCAMAEPSPVWDPARYCRAVVALFARLRHTFGEEIDLLHDIHGRLPPIQAIQLARDLEQFRLFFLEDPLPPEDLGYFPLLRQQTSLPLAIGEVFVNVHEYLPLVRDRLIDFIRVHPSHIGGLSPARKLATLCEFFGVRTAWHGPRDITPVGTAANLHLDLACHNFGIQEHWLSGERMREVFPVGPEVRDGYLWPNDRPGLGVDIDEGLAAKYPFPEHPLNGGWSPVRRADGTVIRP
jgi:mannonate dehydratase